jgi:hypothetical protein
MECPFLDKDSLSSDQKFMFMLLERIEYLESEIDTCKSEFVQLKDLIRKNKCHEIFSLVDKFMDWKENVEAGIDGVNREKYDMYTSFIPTTDQFLYCKYEKEQIALWILLNSLPLNNPEECIRNIWKKLFPYHDVDHIVHIFTHDEITIYGTLETETINEEKWNTYLENEDLKKNNFEKFMKLEHNSKIYYTEESIKLILNELTLEQVMQIYPSLDYFISYNLI